MDARNLVQYYNHYIGTHPKTIVEFGSFDLRDALILAKAYPTAKVYSFEANPELYNLCIANNQYPDRVSIKNAAVYNENTTIDFYITAGNTGASSVLKWKSFIPWTTNTTTHVVQVEAVRLDTFLTDNEVSSVDLMWMDAQGSELLCLQGAGEYLKDIKMIQTEVGIHEYYENHTLYPEIKEYLSSYGFEEILYAPDWSHESNVVFINKQYLKGN